MMQTLIIIILWLQIVVLVVKPQGNEAVGDAISGVSRLFAVEVVATMALFLIAVWGMVLFQIRLYGDPEMDRP
jgi:hypothetical protein